MINLLPPQAKDDLLQEEKLKQIFITGIVFFAVLISFTLILFAIRSFVLGSVEAQRIFVDRAQKDFEDSQLQVVEKHIVEANAKLDKLDGFYQNQTLLAPIVDKISELLPVSTYLNAVSAVSQPQDKKVMLISVSGFALNRETLIKFKDNLEKDGNFKEVSFPAENWVEPEDINFSATFQASRRLQP